MRSAAIVNRSLTDICAATTFACINAHRTAIIVNRSLTDICAATVLDGSLSQDPVELDLLQNYDRNSMLGRMGEGEVCGSGSRGFKQSARMAVKEQKRLAGFIARNFDIVPAQRSHPTSPQRFERGFLGRKPCGIMLGGSLAAAIAIGAFPVGEDARGKSRRALQSATHALDFDNVYAYGDDHG